MKKSELFDTLRERILQIDLAPGAALDEATLCEEYGISRTPLRDVLHRLAGEGYARIEPNRGASVSPMDIGTMRSFFQTAPMIYASVVRLAAENAKPAGVDALRDIQGDFRHAVAAGCIHDMALLNHRFHETVGAIANSPYLMPSLKRLLIDHTRMGHTFYEARSPADSARIATACDQHDAMIEAIAAHEPARAVALTIDHWELSRQRIERFVRPDPLPINPEIEARDAV